MTNDEMDNCAICKTEVQLEPAVEEVPAYLPEHWEYIEMPGGGEQAICPRCLEKRRNDKDGPIGDFRATADRRTDDYSPIKDILQRGGRDALHLYTFDDLPPDRKGLIAAFHPVLEYTGATLTALHASMEQLAIETNRPIFFVMTKTKWRLILFGYERVPTEDDGGTVGYDDEEKGEYANDQFVSHYETDGTYRVDSIS